ncbi:MAG: TIGR03936 family radical SAM-associated protein [Candidatus Cryosericum sp.]
MRIRYSKEEEACLLSHHEVQAALVRWLRRSNLSLAYSEGFNQRVRIETGIPTGVGMVSLQEYVDVILVADSPISDRTAALERTAPPGLRFLAAVDIPLSAPSLMGQPMILRYEYAWPHKADINVERMKDHIAAFLALPALSVQRDNSKSRIPKDIRKYVLTAQISTRTPLRAHVGVFFDQSGTIRMDEVIKHIFGLEPASSPMPVITRQSVLLNMGGAFVDPMDVSTQLSQRQRSQGNRQD